MSRLVVFAVSCFAQVAAAEEAIVAGEAEEEAPRQALLAKLAVGEFTNGPGLSFERLTSPHLAVVVGVDARADWFKSGTRLAGRGELGARWYFFERPLSGPWVGLHFALGASRSEPTYFGSMTSNGGVTSEPILMTATSLTLAGRLLVGWTFRFGNRLTVQLAAGPTGGVTRTAHAFNVPYIISNGPTDTQTLGFTAQCGVGVAF